VATLRDETHAEHIGSVSPDAQPNSPGRHEPHPLALLAHELRTPLNAVLGYADAWRMEAFGPLPAPYREQAAVIHAAASHLLAVVDAMTAVGAAEAGDRPLAIERLGPAAQEKLLADVVSLLTPRARASNLELRATVGAPAVEIGADPVALTQILINLIDNAVKFSLPGGTITVRLDVVESDLHLIVENVANAGTTAGGAGSGLGLRLVRALSEAMGGSLTVDLSSGDRRRTIVRLPATAAS
jgi:signal transduction histidine kinase